MIKCPTGLDIQTVNLEINYFFHNLIMTQEIEDDVNRIFQDMMDRDAQNDENIIHLLTLTWIRKNTREDLNAVEVGYSGGSMMGYDPTKITTAIHDEMKLGVPGHSEPGSFKASLNPGAIKRLVGQQELSLDQINCDSDRP